ncbi:hypothetical protein V6C53_18825 [Desulfocurvibacter africanus]|uniref:hypothetical protein n=1 Tax=Desulfocurvibacter africanus TaxID=873 RepID=UPI002FDB6F6C
MKRSEQAQSQHDSMAFTLAGYLGRTQGCALVKADGICGYERPDPIKRDGQSLVPDLMAWRSKPSIAKSVSPNYICEVETACSISSEHTAGQLGVFAAEAKRVGAEFILLVPKAVVPVARDVLTKLGILNARIMSLSE